MKIENRFTLTLMYLCFIVGVIVNRKEFVEIFDFFALIFIFSLFIVCEIFFHKRGKIFYLLVLGIPILMCFYIGYNYVPNSIFKTFLQI